MVPFLVVTFIIITKKNWAQKKDNVQWRDTRDIIIVSLL